MNSIEIVKTSDYELAKVLVCLGFDIIGIDKRDMKRVSFYYKKTSDLEKALNLYWRKEIKVVPQDLHEASREIKAKIYTDYEST